RPPLRHRERPGRVDGRLVGAASGGRCPAPPPGCDAKGRTAVRIMPFRGYRHGGPARDLTPVVAPPSDPISPPMQAVVYAMSPDNIVRISFPRDGEDDKYGRARETLDRWLAEGVWVREELPAVYPYQQIYGTGDATITRAGLVVLGEVTPYAEGAVLPHE